MATSTESALGRELVALVDRRMPKFSFTGDNITFTGIDGRQATIQVTQQSRPVLKRTLMGG